MLFEVPTDGYTTTFWKQNKHKTQGISSFGKKLKRMDSKHIIEGNTDHNSNTQLLPGYIPYVL